VDKKEFDMLHPCGLPYAIEGKLESFEKVKHTLPDMGFTKILNHELIRVTPETKQIEAKNLENGKSLMLEYDNLIIATGSHALIPPIPGVKELLGKGVFTVDSYTQSFDLAEYSKKCKTAVVVGAGAIGLETAYALKKRELAITIVEMLPNALSKSLDPDMSKILEEYLKTNGINLMFDAGVEKVLGQDIVKGITVSGKELACDMVVLAAGVRSNTDFLAGSGIVTTKLGVVVNEKMQTNIPDIYAIGDCVQVKSLIDRRDWTMQLAVAAYKQGVVAGMNISGKKREYAGALSTFASKIGEIEVAATGFNSACAGQNILIGKASGTTRPEWCTGGKDITVKLIVGKDSGKILGGQGVGYAGAAERINIVSTAIQAGLTLHGLSEVELAYCPAVSETYDVLMQAADNAIRKQGG